MKLKIPPPLWALAAGLAAALAHPPFGLIVLVLAYGGMMLLGERAPNLKAAFWRGWLVGLAYFGLSCWWVAEAFFVDAATFGWMAPFGVFFLAGGLALFWGLILLAWRALKPKGPFRFLVFAGVFTAVEWVRGHIFTGFPWNLPGVSWEAGSAMSQGAHLFGAYGMTWLTVALASASWGLLEAPRRWTAWTAAGLGALILAGIYAFGWGELARGIAPESEGRPVSVRIVQVNVSEADNNAANYASTVRKYLDLTTQPGAPQLVVWPEGALPASLDGYLIAGDPVHDAILEALYGGQTLITGGFRHDTQRRAYNAMAVVTDAGGALKVEGLYDKHHLVPFGEYVPRVFAALGLRQLVPLPDATPGPKPQPIDIGLARIQPLICYEALFPGYTARGARLSGAPAQLIVNISNDAWFGKTSGPWQHDNQARYRAIEERLPMIRSTPTGVSSVIDKYGRVESGNRLGQDVAGIVDATVYIEPRKDVSLSNDVHPTGSYTWWRTWGFVVMLGASCLISLSFYGHKQKK